MDPKCSFCGKKPPEVFLVEGDGVYICDRCVDIIYNVILPKKKKEEADHQKKQIELIPPLEIKKHLDEYVIGQEKAKKILSVSVYNHYKRILRGGKDIEKSNVLLIGPTGVGKTYLARILAQILKVPFAIADATTLTEAGYVGEDVENILLRLIQAADENIEWAQMGIIYIDELDKISRKSENPSITRDVSGEGVQQALLKIVEGTVANVPPTGGRKHPEQSYLQIDTTNILFIAGGAFVGLDTIIRRRLKKKVIGFKTEEEYKIEDEDVLQYVEPEDLVKYGIIPELVGRFPVIGTLTNLGKEELKRILIEPKNSLIKQYEKLLKMDNIDLVFTDDAIDAIVEKTMKRETGARGLKSVMEEFMIDVMFEAPSSNVSEIVIDRDFIEGKKRTEEIFK